MAPPAAVAAEKAVTDFPASADPSVAAMDRQTAAIQALVTELTATREAFTPAADAVHSLGAAQEKFCNFLVTNRLKIVAAVPAILVAVGAISPNAAHIIENVMRAAGVQ